ALPASEVMQETGQIFDPHFYLVDVNSHVVYRKERFDNPGDQLPTELIVRDRRYTPEEIARACTDAGFEVLEHYPVRSGRWDDRSLDETALRAREILVTARWAGEAQSQPQ